MDSLMTPRRRSRRLAALITLIVMEVVLGIDNLVFISILSTSCRASGARRGLGINLALIIRLVLLSTIAWIVGLTAPVSPVPGSRPWTRKAIRPSTLVFSGAI